MTDAGTALAAAAGAAPPVWRSPLMSDVAHGFAGRQGGISTGAFASLNCGPGSGEDAAIIAENRRRAADAVLPGAEMAGVHQVHGCGCVTVDKGNDIHDRPVGDALVTNRPGVLLSILTADCVPVLFADDQAAVVGAAHAGWKGALAGVTDATIAAMEALGADRHAIRAVVGPCIARASYEVDTRLFSAFIGQDAANERFFIDGRAGHWQFDLEGYVGERLAAAGLSRIALLGLDTYRREDDFFSFRRSTHRGEPGYGRQISMIGLTG